MMSTLLYCLVLLVTCKGSSDDVNTVEEKLKILLVSDYAYGHMAPLLPVGEELIQRGHNVTMLVAVYESQQERYKSHIEKHGVHLWNVSTENLPELDMNLVGKNLSRALISTMAQLGEYSANLTGIMAKHMNKSFSKHDWDIVIGGDFMQTVFSCMSSVHNIPFVLVGYNSISPYHLEPPWPWPGVMQGATSDDMGFIDRVLYIPASIATQTLSYLTFRIPMNVLSEYCPMVNIKRAVSAVGIYFPTIVPSVIGFEYPCTISSMTDYVGPLISKNPVPLTEDLEEWLGTKPDRSVVYISMGSIMTLDENSGKAFLQGVMNANLSILWSLRKSNQQILESLDKDLDRVKIADWTPQFSVLQSRTIHSAILHGGMNGLGDALWNGVPIIVVPQMKEQLYNAGRVHYNGYGIYLDKDTLSSAKITDSLRTLDTGNYRSKVSKLQKMYRLAGGVERAADLIEFYEAVGYAHLVPAYAKYQWSWVQYYNADVYAMILLILVAVTMCFLACCKCICKRCFATSQKEKKE